PFILFYYLISIFLSVHRLKKVIKDINPEIIHANSIRSGIITSLAKKKEFLIWHIRDILGSGLMGYIIRKLARKADKLVYISEFLKTEFCLKDNELLQKSIVVYNGIDFTKIDAATNLEHFREEFRLNNGSWPLIGCIGYIAPLKGQEEFIRAASQIIRKYPGAKFFIAGDVIFRQKNQRYFKRLKKLIDHDPELRMNVFWTGFYNDIYLLIKSMDLIIQPSWIEGWGRTICEGFACGIPVVCSKVGGIPEIVKYGTNRFLVNSQNVKEILNKTIDILENLDLIKKYIIENQEYVKQKFTLNNYTNNIIGVYDESD
ncbi:glycosyltransferase family 4 protein, partial [Candidatus Dependentiae bacterium]|nr:glycosyltransferase family 4 protein [Candidatus Dependentiae bacterium]